MWLFAVKQLVLVIALTNAQAPGDADPRCTVEHERPPTYPDNVKTLMDSYHYVTLLPNHGTGNPPLEGAVWNDMSYDDNDITGVVNPTYWQQDAGGICRFQTTVCGYQEGDQDNWLFTQHIDKSVDPLLNNYVVQIRVTLTYALISCRERLGCNPEFEVYRYKTNNIQPASTANSSFMNRDNYVRITTIVPSGTSITLTEMVTFEMDPKETGFYLAIRDPGTCLGLSRMLVQRFNCAPFQDGLILYPDAPAPISGSAPVDISCVNNAQTSGSGTVTCSSNGMWGQETPVCGCSLGYEVDTDTNTTCDICPEGEYQALVSPTERCKTCPARSSADEEGAGVCGCDETYIRLPSRPDDPCIRAPSAPRFDLNHAPVLDGTDISVVWIPSKDPGENPSNLYYDVYAAQLAGEDPTFCKQNDAQIDNDCNDGEQCSYKVTGLDANTPYALLLVASNSATDDPECIQNITLIDCRYLVLVVGTEDAKTDGLSAGAAAGITFIVTLIFTAAVTAVVVIVIVYFVLRRSSRKDDICSPTSKQTTSPASWGQERSKPAAPRIAQAPSQPVAPPPRPGSAPKRPMPPSRPPHTPSSHTHPHSHSQNGY